MEPSDKRVIVIIFILWHNFGTRANDWRPTNVRGYLYFPTFGSWDYSDRKLEVIFDYDSMSVPLQSLVHVECLGHRNCTKDDFAKQTCGETADWQGNKTTVVKPYQATLFDAPFEIDQYLCRARISDPEQSVFGLWSDFGAIELLYEGSVINPKPALVVCQAMQYPPNNYGRLHLIRVLDVDAANTPNETAVQTFDLNCNLALNGIGALASYQTPLCFDWIANWQYRLNGSDYRCLLKVDTLKMRPELPVSCYEAQILRLQCYSPLGLLFFTLPQSPTSPSKGYRLMSYDMKPGAGTSRGIAGTEGSITGKNCNRTLSHFWIAFDWRPYWNKNLMGEAKLVFISGLELWTYNIVSDTCEKMIELEKFGLTDLRIDEIPRQILQFDMDWSYFYWIDGSSYDIRAVSWKTGKMRIFDKLRIFNAEKQEQKYNLTQPIYDDMKFMVGLLKHTPAARPYPFPFECLIPDLRVMITMSNVTNAIVAMEKMWNVSDVCKRTNRPPPQLKLWCVSGDSQYACEIGVNLYRGRQERYTTELKKLVKGQRYNITIQVSIIGNEQLFKTFETPFVAEMPKTVDKTWERNLSTGLAVVSILVLAALVTAYFGWYRKRKAMRDFLRRERIDASELTLVKKIGQGKFGEVSLARYRPCDQDQRGIGSVIDVALKMRKSDRGDYESTLLSADCFFQEAVALSFLRHTNIIQAYGLCTNYQHRPPILVLEYMNGGSCLDYVKAERDHLTKADLSRICRDVLRACVHLANMHVVHKDIGAKNVLVKKNDRSGKPEIAKLTDFGLAADVGKIGGVYTITRRNSIHNRSTAPEGFDGQFSSQSDVWSFGIFVWELYSLLEYLDDDPLPFSQMRSVSKESILSLLKSTRLANRSMMEDPKFAPLDVCMLMQQCWAEKPSDRLTFRQLNAHWRPIGSHAGDDHRPIISAFSDRQPSGGAPLERNDAADAALDEGPSPATAKYPVSVAVANPVYTLPKGPAEGESSKLLPDEAGVAEFGYTVWAGAAKGKSSEEKPDKASRILFLEHVSGCNK